MAGAAWLVGYASIGEETPQIGVSDVTVVTGTYALRHATAAISLIDALAQALTDVYGAGYSVVILRNRLVRITLNVAGVITWGPATVLRDLLGFTGDRGSSTTHTADMPSPLLFSAGFVATPSTPLATVGYTVPHQSAYKSDDGTQIFNVRYGSETWLELGWSHILPERMQVADASAQGGTFKAFWDRVAGHHRRFTYYQEIDEDDASSSAVTWTTGRGPYALREVDPRWYRRTVQNSEVSNSLELPLMKLAEVA